MNVFIDLLFFGRTKTQTQLYVVYASALRLTVNPKPLQLAYLFHGYLRVLRHQNYQPVTQKLWKFNVSPLTDVTFVL